MIVAIDGPSGSGKSTLGKMLADALDAVYIDTGAMYRAVALAVTESGCDLSDKQGIAGIAKRSQISLVRGPQSLRVILDGRDVSEAIRTESVTSASSVVSAIPEVRRTLVERQRQMGIDGNVVMDGRDIGTVVFPDAEFKFFLTASEDRRALRRYEEEKQRGRNVSYDEIRNDLVIRDARDSTRADSPLVAAADAIHIDSTNMTTEDVLDAMLETINKGS